MTAIGTGASTDHAIWTCYAVKADPNTGNPIYIAVADTTRYGTLNNAITGITDGLNAQVSGTLFQALEPAQLGQVIVTTLLSDYIIGVNIAKSTARSGTSSG